jgi:hypothetical protein
VSITNAQTYIKQAPDALYGQKLDYFWELNKALAPNLSPK